MAVASPDKDFFQLLRPGIILLRQPKKPAAGEHQRLNKFALVPYSEVDFEREHGLQPQQFVDVLALAGDTSGVLLGHLVPACPVLGEGLRRPACAVPAAWVMVSQCPTCRQRAGGGWNRVEDRAGTAAAVRHARQRDCARSGGQAEESCGAIEFWCGQDVCHEAGRAWVCSELVVLRFAPLRLGRRVLASPWLLQLRASRLHG